MQCSDHHANISPIYLRMLSNGRHVSRENGSMKKKWKVISIEGPKRCG